LFVVSHHTFSLKNEVLVKKIAISYGFFLLIAFFKKIAPVARVSIRVAAGIDTRVEGHHRTNIANKQKAIGRASHVFGVNCCVKLARVQTKTTIVVHITTQH
jgi:hypothetical protein